MKLAREVFYCSPFIMTQVIIKVIGPPEMHVKQYLFCICFMRLKGSLDIFRKSHEVLALNFDPFGVHLHVETNLGLHDKKSLLQEMFIKFRSSGQSEYS